VYQALLDHPDVATTDFSSLLVCISGGAPLPPPVKQQFETVTGATLVGHFSVVGHPIAGKDLADRYEIDKAEKIEGHRWLITARIKYGKHDVKVPVPLEVYWAGDTPVIELTDLAIPGLGTFTARVLFYGDQYAGTWSGGDHGGHLYGKVVRK